LADQQAPSDLVRPNNLAHRLQFGRSPVRFVKVFCSVQMSRSLTRSACFGMFHAAPSAELSGGAGGFLILLIINRFAAPDGAPKDI
jgi:hypothetical protein